MRAILQASAERRRAVSRLQRLVGCWQVWVPLLLVVLPISIWGAVRSWEGITNNVEDWLPQKLKAEHDLEHFVKLFGSDELLMIRWDGCTLDDPRLEQFRQAVLSPAEGPQGPVEYFRSVLTAPRMLEFYEEKPLSLSREDALDRMRGWLVGADGRKTGLLALVSDAGVNDRPAAVDHVYAAAGTVAGLTPEDLYVAGPTLNGVAIDRASQKNLLGLNLASFAVCVLILLALQRSLRVALVVFLTALFNEQLAMALVYYSGTNMDSVLLLSANLTFVLSISVGVHLVNYYRDALHFVPASEAPAWGCVLALKPTALATLTTALGLASLQVSEILPITRFGFFASIAVLAAAVSTMLLVSLHFTLWPLRPKQGAQTEPLRGWEGYAGVINRLRWPIVALVFVGLVGGGIGAARLKSSVGLNELLSSKSRVVKDYERLESEIGPLTPIEVVVRTAPGDARRLLAQFRAIDAAHGAVRALGDQYTVLSIRTFSPPPPPEKGGAVSITRSAVFRRSLLNNSDRLRDLGYLVITPEDHYWRITVRCPSSMSLGFGEALREVESAVTGALADRPDVEVRELLVGGGVPLAYETQRQMLRDLIKSFLWAFAMVGGVLMLVFRSVACGLICMAPNVLPCAVAFGAMGFLGVPVELGTILTASAALGIAVDDTMHFITWFQRAVSRGDTVPEAVLHSLQHCANAMIQTTLICGFGLAVFVLSDFLPIAKFGATMFVLLFLALAADLVTLPALLLTPFGRPFLKRASAGADPPLAEDSLTPSKA